MNQICCVGVGKQFSREGGGIPLLAHRAPWKKSTESDKFWALKGVDLTVSPGQRIGIWGANGCGKTTLLRIIAGITHPTCGRVAVNGHVVPLIEPWSGMQHDLTGRENIYLSGIILGMCRREVQRKFDSIVEFAGLSRFLHMPLKHYSWGMIVRLGFSIAIHVEADILLVDEIWGVGDREFQTKSFNEIRRIQAQGVTTLIVSHDLEVIRLLADEVWWLKEGGIAAWGPKDSVFSSLAPIPEPSVSSLDVWNH